MTAGTSILTIRPFDPVNDDYESIVAIYNANWPDERQYTAAQWREEDKEWPAGSLHRRFMGPA